MTAAFKIPAGAPSRMSDPFTKDNWQVRLLMKLLAREDVRPEPKQVEEFTKYQWIGDPLADAVVAMYFRMPAGEGRKLVEEALEKGIDNVANAPDELVQFFRQVESVPLWLNRQKLDEGCEVIRRTGWFAELVLRNVSLMGGYLSSAANKPLAFTGQLDKMAPKRLIETGKFWVDVTTPGGMDRFNEGFKSAVRVRLMHATVRYMLNKSGRWNYQAWGEPINQADTQATNMLFSHIFLIGLRGLGFRFTREERESVIHLWRYVGFLLGIDEKILPADETDSYRMAYLHYATFSDYDDDTRALGESLTKVPYTQVGDSRIKKLLADIEVNYRSGLSRLVLGNKNADALGLPDNFWKYLVLGTVPTVFAAETVRKNVPGATWTAMKLGRLLHEKMLPHAIKVVNADTGFNAVKTLAR